MGHLTELRKVRSAWGLEAGNWHLGPYIIAGWLFDVHHTANLSEPESL